MLGELPLIRVRYVPHRLACGIPGAGMGCDPVAGMERRSAGEGPWTRWRQRPATCLTRIAPLGASNLQDDADPAPIGSTNAFPEVAFAPSRRFPYETSEHWLWMILRRLPSPFFEAIARARYDCSSRKGGLMTSTFIGIWSSDI